MANPNFTGMVTEVEAPDASEWQWVTVTVDQHGTEMDFLVPMSAGIVAGKPYSFPDSRPTFRCPTPEPIPAPV
jgi:hypothetical protein